MYFASSQSSSSPITRVTHLCFALAVSPIILRFNVKHGLLNIIHHHVKHIQLQRMNEVRSSATMIQPNLWLPCFFFFLLLLFCVLVVLLLLVCSQCNGWKITEQTVDGFIWLDLDWQDKEPLLHNVKLERRTSECTDS